MAEVDVNEEAVDWPLWVMSPRRVIACRIPDAQKRTETSILAQAGHMGSTSFSSRHRNPTARTSPQKTRPSESDELQGNFMPDVHQRTEQANLPNVDHSLSKMNRSEAQTGSNIPQNKMEDTM